MSNRLDAPKPLASTAAIPTKRRHTPRGVPTWLVFIGKKLAHLSVVLLAVTFLVSALVDLLPGDPARAILGDNATEEQLAQVREDLHLDDPVFTRYLIWLGNVLTGDFGVSIRTGQPVGEAIMQRLPVSLELMILAQVLALVVAIALAMYAAYRPNGAVDKLSTIWSFAAISAPHFVVGLALIFVFSVTLGWLPTSGYVPLTPETVWVHFSLMLMPAFALALEPAGVYQRLLRGDLQTTMREDFVLAAQAKGMTTPNILFRQVFRPSSFSLVTLAGINTARLLGSTLVIETLFALPGIGRLLVDSVNSRDFIMVQSTVAVIAIFYVLVNIVIDLLYLVLDPRVRSARG